MNENKQQQGGQTRQPNEQDRQRQQEQQQRDKDRSRQPGEQPDDDTRQGRTDR